MTPPPYADLLGATLAHDEAGAPILTMPFAEHVTGRPGFLHGGAIGGLLEIAAIAALRHALGGHALGGHALGAARTRITPVTVTIDYQRSGRDAPTRATGTVTRLGARIANVEAVAWQDDRTRPIAAARMNYLLERG